MKRKVTGMCRIGVVVATGLIAVSGCNTLTAREHAQIEQARGALASGRFAQCEQTLDRIIQAHGESPAVAEALYIRGQCRLATARRTQAHQDFEAGRRLAKDDTLRANLEAQIGNMAYDDDRYQEACGYYARALEDLPKAPPTDRVLYQYAVALQRSQRFGDARRVFGEVVRRYPGSIHAAQAQRKQSFTGEEFFVQCGVFQQVEHANEMAARLRGAGFNALTSREIRDNGTRYVVRIGRFPSYDQARHTLERVRPMQSDAFIVP
jgi:tetratricopeptide (TPR) repeat protein